MERSLGEKEIISAYGLKFVNPNKWTDSDVAPLPNLLPMEIINHQIGKII